jgi:hypothetical protein
MAQTPDSYYVSSKLKFLMGLEQQIICASTSELAEWERIGLLNRIHEIRTAMVDPVEQPQSVKEVTYIQKLNRAN